MKTPDAEKALTALCDTIEATGGVKLNEDGTYSPEGEPDWIDLADAYLIACAALDRSPKIVAADGEPI